MSSPAQIAIKLVSPKKGILAADWSLGTSEKHFKKNGIEHTKENRRKYRQLLFSIQNLEKYISGIIFFDETIRQKTENGVPFPEYLEKKGIIPGIKVDQGAKEMANFPGEKITDGLVGLRERLEEYKKLGAKFTKWRAAIAIGEDIPTEQCIESNSEALARFAALSQEAGLVPVVEPEDLMKGVHLQKKSEEVTKKVLSSVFSALEKHKVNLEGTILKTNFVHPGSESGEKINYRSIAEASFRTLERTVPPTIPGIVFLSGGDGPEESTQHLNEIVKYAKTKKDVAWEFSFSFARALQYPTIKIWGGKEGNVKKAQSALIKRAKLNSLARQGLYEKKLENE